MCQFIDMKNQMMKLVTKDKNTSKKQTDNTKSEIQIECKMELWKKSQVATVWCWGRWRDSPYAASGPYEGNLIDVNEESGCDEKYEYVTEEVTLAKKPSWRYFTTLKAQRIKCQKLRQSEAYDNLSRHRKDSPP